jgi:outer membrane protein assembly factor BamB
MYKNKMLLKKFIIFLALLLPLSACMNNKKTSRTSELEDTILWQYSNYLNNTEIDTRIVNKENYEIVYIDNSLRLPLISQPIIGKDYYIGMNRKGVVSRINTVNNKTVWQNKQAGRKFIFYSNYLNGGLLQQKNKIYASFGSDFINCLNSKTGELIWQQKLQEIVRAYPILEDNILYLQTLNNGMYSINANNGTILWYKSGLSDGVSVVNVISPIIHKNAIIMQDSYGNINTINKYTGFDEWSFDEENISFENILNEVKVSTYQPLKVEGFLYFYTSGGYLFKLNLSNKEIAWKEKYNIDGPIHIHNNIAYTIDDKNTLLAINLETGQNIWKASLIDHLEQKEKKKNRYWNSPVVINNLIYVFSSKGEVLTFKMTGDFNNIKYKVGKGSYISPINTGTKIYIIS